MYRSIINFAWESDTIQEFVGKSDLLDSHAAKSRTGSIESLIAGVLFALLLI